MPEGPCFRMMKSGARGEAPTEDRDWHDLFSLETWNHNTTAEGKGHEEQRAFRVGMCIPPASHPIPARTVVRSQ